MNTALAITNYGELEQTAKALAQSGFFSDVSSVSQAIVKVMAGSELGLPPFASMSGIHIIKGKPALGANVIATLIKNDPRYDYRVKELTDTMCVIEFFENGEGVGVSEFSAEDAEKAGTQNMHKFPRNMLFARAISNGARWYTPGIFGGAPIYTPDELGAQVDEDGYIDGEVIEDAQPEPVEPGFSPTGFESDVVEVEEMDPYTAAAYDLLEGKTFKTVGDLCDIFAQQHEAYSNSFHVLNALDKHPDMPEGFKFRLDQKLTYSKGVRFAAWLIERKAQPEQPALVEPVQEVAYG